MKDSLPLRVAFSNHNRRWRDFYYVYPVISRRSKGLSIGVNLNPDTACNFDCVYCSVDRTIPPRVREVDPAVLAAELRALVGGYERLFSEPEFSGIPPVYRRLNDVAFSGDGEPTASPLFPDVVRLTVDVLAEHRLSDVKIVVITDACYLTRPKVIATLGYLDAHNSEIWAKLDAGTEEYFRLVNRPNYPLQHVLDNILVAGRARPIVLQSLFMRLHGEPPPPGEIEAYVGRVRALRAAGAQIKLVQVYTVARRATEPYVQALTDTELEALAERLRPLGVAVEVYP